MCYLNLFPNKYIYMSNFLRRLNLVGNHIYHTNLNWPVNIKKKDIQNELENRIMVLMVP